MNKKKLLLVAGVLSIIGGNVFADNTVSSDSSNILINNGKDNVVTNSTNVNIVGSANEINNAFNSSIVGFKSYVDGGGHNLVVGSYSGADGRRSIAIGDNAGAYAKSMEDYKNKVDAYNYDTGKYNPATGVGAIAIGGHAKADVEMNTAIGYLAESEGNYNTAIGSHSIAKGDPHKVNSKYAGVNNAKGVFSIANMSGENPGYYLANSPVGAPSFYYEDSSDGRDGFFNIGQFTRQLQGVAAGEVSATSTDAVNGSQLYTEIKETREMLKIPMDWLENHEARIETNKQNIKDIAIGVSMLGDAVKENTDNIAMNTKLANDAMEEAKKHTIVKAGDNITVTEDSGTYTVSTAKDLTDMNSINLNDGNSESHYTVKGVDMTYRGDFEYHTQYNYDGMHIKVNDGDNQPINNEVSVTDKGLNNGNNKIINVSRGENDTDAINVSQLKETNKKVDDNTKVIENHEGRITDLEHKTVDVGRNALERANHYTDLQVNKGVAKASALAGLKFLDYNPKDKWSFAASVGHYRNANAVAVGAAYQPNENTMVHGGITVDGKVAYNLGVSFKTGGQKYINKYELAEQIRQLQSDNAELRQELAELRSMIESNK